MQPALIDDRFLNPGEFYFGNSHTRIRTLLGSCVAITFWHPQCHIGGMCHYMLPGRGKDLVNELSGKYADEALQMFMQEIAHHKTKPQEYEIKLFGGGNMLEVLGQSSRAENVAERNIQAARWLLSEYGLKIKAESLGGVGYRQIVFELWSGDVWSRKVRGVIAGIGGERSL